MPLLPLASLQQVFKPTPGRNQAASILQHHPKFDADVSAPSRTPKQHPDQLRTMADVDMTDAPTAPPASTSVVKKKGAAGAADGDSKGDGKKRFEVKKVGVPVRRRAPTPFANGL